jgi:hypothetical protein
MGLFAALVAAPAQAQDYDIYDRDADDDGGMSFFVGGGVMDFTDSDTRDFTDLAGTWEARLGVGTRSIIGLEAAYIGAAQGVEALGLDDSAVLTSHGAEANFRLNFSRGGLQPYALAGAGWRHYSVTNDDFNTSDVNDSDDVFEIPLGVGITYHLDPVLLDLRGVFRPAFGSDLVGDDEELHNWSARMNVGWEF